MSNVYGSETISQIIVLLDLGSDHALRQREIARRLNIQLRPVQLGLAQLEKRGLVHAEQKDGYRLYSLNRESIHYAGVHRLALADVGIGNLLSPYASEITGAIIFGSAARGDARADSDFDVLVISSLDESVIETSLKPLSERLRRRIDIANLDYFAFLKRLRNDDAFITKALAEGALVMGKVPQ